MKIELSKSIVFGVVILLFAGLSACQDVIPLEVETGASQLVVDGWLTNQTGSQSIKLTKSAAYFDNSTAKPAIGATVTVTDSDGKVFDFKDLKNDGVYVWLPKIGEIFGRIANVYTLVVQYEGESYRANSKMNRVPFIDSIGYRIENRAVAPENAPKTGFSAEFFAKDPIGEGDCFWIRSYRNGKRWSEPQQISIAYDGAFSPGVLSDGLLFIRPLRLSITPFPELYQDKDTVKTEIFSITEDAYYFLFQVRQESQNRGLFATPPANIPTNVRNINTNSTKTALGYFGISAVSSYQDIVDKKRARPKNS